MLHVPGRDLPGNRGYAAPESNTMPCYPVQGASRRRCCAGGIRAMGAAGQRRRDFYSCAHQRKDPWTTAEDGKLQYLLQQHKYGWAEVAAMLNRSVGAVQRRCNDLGLKERPIRANNHNPWSDADFQTLADGIRNGFSYSDIGNMVGRSEKAVRGRVYEAYRTENADKVRDH